MRLLPYFCFFLSSCAVPTPVTENKKIVNKFAAPERPARTWGARINPRSDYYLLESSEAQTLYYLVAKDGTVTEVSYPTYYDVGVGDYYAAYKWLKQR